MTELRATLEQLEADVATADCEDAWVDILNSVNTSCWSGFRGLCAPFVADSTNILQTEFTRLCLYLRNTGARQHMVQLLEDHGDAFIEQELALMVNKITTMGNKAEDGDVQSPR